MDSDENIATFKEEYGLGDEVTGDTLWGEVRETVELQQQAEYQAMMADEESGSDDTEDVTEEEVTEAPADSATEAPADAAAETAAEATETPAE